MCVISIPKVQVNNDISSYLPEETETRRGLTLMDDEFITYDTEKNNGYDHNDRNSGKAER